ncbi:MAG TPA: type I polyketide synthase [Conexibacter sp.]|nr:type I polyketide synthase [Conexibacter sp.]
MSAASSDDKLLPQLKRVLLELRDTRRQLDDLESREREPIAIVGMGCRFPGGADSPEALWELIAEGRDAIGECPEGRGWDLEGMFSTDPDQRGTYYTRGGAFLHDADQFDADLFSIAPREAVAMDPQQRLLLETTWEALEHAGIAPDSLRGSDAGVFVGVSSNSYGIWPRVLESTEGFQVTGTAPSVASGRLAYTFGLEGPAVSIDTACSSSLVALHLACQALRRGECELAVSGGSMVMAAPGLLIDFSRQRALSPDGRCKAFGASADGAGFSDGVGVVLLERLSRARAAGREVLAVIRGSAVNQDGASNGLTAPNGPSQVRVIRDALVNAGLSAGDVDAVEGHGTGTPLGDPIEAQALLDTYGQERSNGPLYLGSVKSNVGHAATAAGVAGVIKVVQALRHEQLPRSLHCEEPSPHVDWSEGEIELLSEAVAWPRGARPRRAGVSSFGVSGTNAHLILEEAPAADAAAVLDGDVADAQTPARDGVLPFLLSAANEEALAPQAERLAAFLEARPQADPYAVACGLALRRAHLPERAAVIATGREELIVALRALAHGEEPSGVVHGHARSGATALLFSGQGSQWAGMGARLYEQFPVFATALDEACGELDRHLERPLKEVMFAEPETEAAALLSNTRYTQVALFALEVALYRLVEQFGVRPDFLIGHSVGEFAAAHVAGVFSLGDGCRLVAERARLMSALPAGGAMLAVEASQDEVIESLAAFEGRLSLAAVNGPLAVTVSGEEAAIDELEALWRERGRRTTRLDVSHAFHSHLMEPMLEELEAVARQVELSAPQIPIVSNVTGRQLTAEEARSPEYWVRHVRQPVRFADGVELLAGAGVTRFLELGPNTVLAALAAQSPALEQAEPLFASSLRGPRLGEREALLGFLASAHCSGLALDWRALLDDRGVGPVELPTYAFQRRSYWADPGTDADPAAVGQLAGEHPLLGAAVRLAGAEGWLLTGRLSLASQPWLADHAVGGMVLLPATAFVELALAAAQRVGAAGLDDLTLVAPLVLDPAAGINVQVSVAGPDEDGRRPLNVYSAGRAGDEGGDEEDGEPQWTLHATGLLAAPGAEDGDAPSLGAWPPAGAQEVDVERFYETIADAGYDYGPAFRGLRAAWRDGDAWLAEIELDGAQQGQAAEFLAHPALLDAALHTALLAAIDQQALDAPAVPFSFAGVRLHAPGAAALRVRVELDEQDGTRTMKLVATDQAGIAVLAIDHLEARALDPAMLRTAGRTAGSRPLYEHSWIQLAGAAEDAAADAAEHAATNGSDPAAGGASTLATLTLLGEAARLASAGVDCTAYADVAALERAIADGAPAPELVLVNVPGGSGDVVANAHAVTTWALELLQAWLASEALESARLVILTDGALAVRDGESPDLAQAAVPGLVRSAGSEHPLRFGLVDLGPGETAGALGAALESDEPELALRDGAVYAPRLVRAGSAGTLIPPADAGAWRLGTERPGSLEDLALLPSQAGAAPLGEGEVRIAVQAAGLNFRDVLIALGMYPGKAPLGSEAAGVVAEVGPGVDALETGDRVFGFMPECFGSHAMTDARLVTRIPDGWSFEQAAAVPTVFLTAYYGLVDVADLRRGERVLVHAGAGGVGMAAIQIARGLGAEVFSTAHPDKWDALRGLGLDDDHIASSRDLAFKDAFLAATDGAGVDVVLDALTGEFVDASLELLPRGGRFVEIGKADVREPDRVAADHPGVRYRAFDLLEAGPERLQAMLAELLEQFASDAYRHPPIATWDVRNGPDAFRHMREARHVGKLVLTVPQRPELDGTVLITGGTGGLGALVARHLAGEHGARRLLLTSRRGLEAEGAAELVAELGELGCEAAVAACDVADRAQVEALLAEVDDGHPLVGVVHAAGVLDDGTITSLDAEQLRRVMAPKVDGVMHLNELTEDCELSFFVLFSSAAAALGSPGQGNYAAANAFLDGLAHHRHAQGLAATSLDWGTWERDTGIAADAERSRVSRMGVVPFSDEEGLSLLDAALGAAQPQLVPIRPDMATLRRAADVGVLSPILSALVRVSERRSGAGKGALARMLADAPEPERQRIALDLVRGHIATVLGHPSPQAVDPDKNFKDMGFDSLAAVEMRNRLIQATGLRLPATVVFDHPTPTAVAVYLIGKLAPGASQRPAIDDQLDQLDGLLRSLPDDATERVKRRLRSMLAGLGEDAAREQDEATERAIESASADELLELINEELEKS